MYGDIYVLCYLTPWGWGVQVQPAPTWFWFWLLGKHSGRWPERPLFPSAPWTQTGCLTISIEGVRLQNATEHLLLRCWWPECDMVTVTGMRSRHRTLNWPFSGQNVSLPAVPPKCRAQYDPRNWMVIFHRVKELSTHQQLPLTLPGEKDCSSTF